MRPTQTVEWMRQLCKKERPKYLLILEHKTPTNKTLSSNNNPQLVRLLLSFLPNLVHSPPPSLS